MNIIDLTGKGIKAHSIFFDHYQRYWGGTNKTVDVSLTEIDVNKTRAKNYLDISEKLLINTGLDTRDISALLVVGSGSANGHAMFDGEHGIAWFAVEGFETELKAKAFVMHELVHAMHYQMSPSFWFISPKEQRTVSRQLIIEGIATYGAKKLLNLTDMEALWGGHLKSSDSIKWLESCDEFWSELLNYVRIMYESSDPAIGLFDAHDPSHILEYRQGYYVGLKVIESIVSIRQISLCELLCIPAPELKRMALEVLNAPEFINRNVSYTCPVSGVLSTQN